VAKNWVVLLVGGSRHPVGVSRPRALSRKDRRGRASHGLLPDDLYIQNEPLPRIGRSPKHDLSTWSVTDDWPEHVPVTNDEVDVFEAWFGDLFDELFGPCR
jgi:hypothetical protein